MPQLLLGVLVLFGLLSCLLSLFFNSFLYMATACLTLLSSALPDVSMGSIFSIGQTYADTGRPTMINTSICVNMVYTGNISTVQLIYNHCDFVTL